jgi:hypothetical protein
VALAIRGTDWDNDSDVRLSGLPCLVYASENLSGNTTVVRLDAIQDVSSLSDRDKVFAKALLTEALANLSSVATPSRAAVVKRT